MQIPGGPFDSSQVDPAVGFKPLPPGDYLVGIMDSSVELTKAQNGKMLKLNLAVVGGEFDGRKLFDRLLLEHPSQQAVDIARAKLSAICRAVGVPVLTDSSQLHGKTLTATIKVKPASGEYEASNEIKSYAPGPGAQTQTSTAPAQQPQDQQSPAQEAAPSAPSASGGGGAPWAS